MKFCSIILSLLITLNLFASTQSLEGLGQAFDEYQFFLTVEWDQKDQREFDNKTRVFQDKLKELSLKNQISKEDVLGYMKTKFKNEQMIEDLEKRISLLPQTLTEVDLKNIFKEVQAHATKGASWNGDAGAVVGFILGLIVVVAMFRAWACVDGELQPRESCGTNWVCAHYEFNYSTNTRQCVVYEEEYRCRRTSVCVEKSDK